MEKLQELINLKNSLTDEEKILLKKMKQQQNMKRYYEKNKDKHILKVKERYEENKQVILSNLKSKRIKKAEL